MKIKSFLNGAASLTLSVLFVKILGVIYKIPLSYVLDDVGMGYFNSAYTVYGVFYVICSAGVPKAITCIVSEKIASGNRGEWVHIYKFSLRMFAFIGALVCAVYMLLCPLSSKIISNERAVFTMLAVGPSILFVGCAGVAKGYLASLNRFNPIAISQAIEAIVKLLLGLLFAFLGKSMNLPVHYISAMSVMGITVGSAICTVYLLAVARIYNKAYIFRQYCGIDRTELAKKIGKIAIPIALGSSILTVSALVDMTVMTRAIRNLGYSEEYATAIYGNYTTLAVPMFNLLVSLLAPLTVCLLPKLVEIKTSSESALLSDKVNEYSFLTAALVSPCAFILHFFSFDILDILFTSYQSAIGYKLLSYLSLGLIFLCTLNVLNTAHEAAGNYNVSIISLIAGVVVKMICEPLLILKTPLGILGSPVSTVISYATSFAVSLFIFGLKGYKFKISSCLCPFLISFFVFYLGYEKVYLFTDFNATGFSLLVYLLLLTAVYFAILALAFVSIKVVKRVIFTKKPTHKFEKDTIFCLEGRKKR